MRLWQHYQHSDQESQEGLDETVKPGSQGTEKKV